MINTKKVIVLGGGFAGMQVCRNLDPKYFDVLLIDKLNHHQFQPLFYQVATSLIEPASISFPLRYVLRKHKNVQVRMADVTRIEEKKVQTSSGEFSFDYLVVAIGCTTNFFGNDQIKQYAFTLKSTSDAIAIRNHVIQTFEHIISATDEERKSLMNLVIVGAGPTGVELAGAFSEIKLHVLPRDYPGIDFSEFRIYLIDNSDQPLNNMSENAQKASRKYLEDMGVLLLTETRVNAFDGKSVTFSSGESIEAGTVIWAAGILGNSIEGLSPEAKAPGNRIRVNRFNQIAGGEDVFAIGDVAFMETPLYARGHPQVANVAINQAKLLARNLKRIQQQVALVEFEYKDRGSMATIGRNKAVVDLPFVRFKGYFAWLIWMFLHLMLILSVKSKIIIFINWAWAYITKDTSLRLILRPAKRG